VIQFTVDRIETVLGHNDYQKLVQWSHPRDPKLQYFYTKFPDSSSGSGSSTAEYVAECEDPKIIKPKEPDMTELALLSIPLDKALAYLEQTNKSGIDILISTSLLLKHKKSLR